MKRPWTPYSHYIPDKPNPRRSYLHQAANIARSMRQHLDGSSAEQMPHELAKDMHYLDLELKRLISKDD